MEQKRKNFPLLQNRVRFVPTFLKLFSKFFFFSFRLTGSIEIKTLLLFIFVIFHAIIWTEIPKMFEDKKI
jgi:hypothetical protein